MTRLAFLVSARGSGAAGASTTPPGVTDWPTNYPALSRGDKISYIGNICVSNGVNAGTPSGRGQQDAHMIGQPRKTNLVYHNARVPVTVSESVPNLRYAALQQQKNRRDSTEEAFKMRELQSDLDKK